MPSRVVVSGIVFVVLTALLVFIVEFFIPLSAKSDMNTACRDMLIKMEIRGGLSAEMAQDLRSELAGKNFTNIVIEGTSSAGYGERLTLRVEADYPFSRLTALFSRTYTVQRMVYEKCATARRVAN